MVMTHLHLRLKLSASLLSRLDDEAPALGSSRIFHRIRVEPQKLDEGFGQGRVPHGPIHEGSYLVLMRFHSAWRMTHAMNFAAFYGVASVRRTLLNHFLVSMYPPAGM